MAEAESRKGGRIRRAAGAAAALAWMLAPLLHASEVQWSRFKGRVKSINAKTLMLTIQNSEGDLVSVKTDPDVEIYRGRELKAIGELAIDDKVVLVYAPKPSIPGLADEPPPGGVYAPARR